MQEEHITCKNCGREIPKTQFCIYCGVNLNESPRQLMQGREHGEVVGQTFEQTETRPSSKAEEASFYQSPYESYTQDIGTPPVTELGIDPEITSLSKELAKLQIWKVKLCNMLVEGEVQEKVFANIYEDYAKKTERLEERRTEIVSKYRNQYDEKRRALEEARLKLEELRVRVTLGELSESDRLIRTPGIKGNVDVLEEEASKLENILGKLENLSIEASSREIFEHEQSARKFLDSLSDLISTGKIGKEFGKKLREDLENVIDQLSRMYRGEDEDEKSLRTELELLDVRYKVGEITLSKLESQRKVITEKLERHWDQSR
jgi:hypothetical protein